MSVWKCPHCTSVAIIVDGVTHETCPKVGCGGIAEKLDEPEAGRAIREAFYAHDHGFSSVDAGLGDLERLAESVKACGSDKTGGAS